MLWAQIPLGQSQSSAYSPSWQPALPARALGSRGQEWAGGSHQECGVRAMGSKGTMLPAKSRASQESSPSHSQRVDGLQLTLPLTGAVDISSCLPGAMYNLCKAQEPLLPSPSPHSDGCPSSSTDFFWVRIKEEEGTAQCSCRNCIMCEDQ